MKTIEVSPGADINATIARAVAESLLRGGRVTFTFNGVAVVVDGTSDTNLIYRDWSRALHGCLEKGTVVGPYPNAVLSPEEVAHDAAVAKADEERASIRQAEWDKKKATGHKTMQELLEGATPLELKDTHAWNVFRDANTDPYGKRCVDYARDWGRLMQVQLARGKTIAQCAGEMSTLADHDGITGFMYGAAGSILRKCWVHGDALNTWHNSGRPKQEEDDDGNK